MSTFENNMEDVFDIEVENKETYKETQSEELRVSQL